MGQDPASIVRPGLLENHEDRLQKVEADSQNTAIEVARHGVKLDNLDSKLGDSVTRILEKIDSSISPVAQKLQNHIESDNAIIEAKKNKWLTLSNVLLVIFGAAFGAIMDVVLTKFFK